MPALITSMHRHGTRARRAITAAALALPLLLGTAAVVPTAAQAATTCGGYVSEDATTPTRSSTVHTRACLDITGTSVQASGDVSVDHSGCPVCLLRVDFRQLTLRVWADGSPKQCWSAYLNRSSLNVRSDCGLPLGKKSYGAKVTAHTQVCFDVRDDGRDVLCGPVASITTTV